MIDAHAEDTLRRDVRLGYSLPPRRAKDLLATIDALRSERDGYLFALSQVNPQLQSYWTDIERKQRALIERQEEFDLLKETMEYALRTLQAVQPRLEAVQRVCFEIRTALAVVQEHGS